MHAEGAMAAYSVVARTTTSSIGAAISTYELGFAYTDDMCDGK